jgi:hypothetical protein
MRYRHELLELLKGFVFKPNAFSVDLAFGFRPRVLAMLEPWAEISERLRRNFSKFSN